MDYFAATDLAKSVAESCGLTPIPTTDFYEKEYQNNDSVVVIVRMKECGPISKDEYGCLSLTGFKHISSDEEVKKIFEEQALRVRDKILSASGLS